MRGELEKLKVFLIVLLAAAGGAAYYYLVYLPAHSAVQEVAYVLSSSIPVVDSRAEIHTVIATLKNGDRVEVLSREGDWARVRTASGQKGWIESRHLTDSHDYEEGRRLLKDLEGIPAQASGHTSLEVNLRLDPSRNAPVLVRLEKNQNLEIYGRRVVARESDSAESAGGESSSAGSETTSGATSRQDVWYLVRTDSRAGWVFGRLVALDIPEGIASYAENANVVAWLTLNTVEDNGREVPQYLVADRKGGPEFDFDHIRVFTWWAAKGHYATAYVESNLPGYFPIRVTRRGDAPYVRLRLVGKDGRKFQKIYRLSETVVRPAGTVEGWVSDALPVASAAGRGRSRR